MKLRLLLFSVIFPTIVFSQNIQLHFPHFKDIPYVFCLFQGDRSDTIVKGIIPADGRVNLVIPSEYQHYAGMSRWLLTASPGGGLDLIINGEDFSVECQEKIPGQDNILYKGTTENVYINQQYQKQMSYFQKIDALKMVLDAYEPTHPISKTMQEELNLMIKNYDAYVDERTKSGLYAARFAEIVDITRGIGNRIIEDEEVKNRETERFITHQMDWKALYTSNHWGMVVYSWIQMHLNILKSDSLMLESFNHISDRISNRKIYTNFVEDVMRELNRQGKDQLIDLLVDNIQKDKLENPGNSLRNMLAQVRLRAGDEAPDLQLFSSSGKKEIINLRKGKPKYQLIFFYESGCAHCEEAIALLTENYQRLTQKGIDVIAVSSDMLTENFLKTAEKFPWKTRICDYKGIQGDNFKNYGVYGTPMFFVVNKTGKIVLKPITATEFIQWAESGALNQSIKSR